MKALWWFKENSIAGMGRPGFNAILWNELPFDEAVVLGWLGQFERGPVSLVSLRDHAMSYGQKIAGFYAMGERMASIAVKRLGDPSGVSEVLARLSRRADLLGDFQVKDGQVNFEFSERRLYWEIDQLQKLGIGTLVTLTELHHSKARLASHFDLHHLAIDDLDAPTFEQAHALAEVIRHARCSQRHGVAVHCLAGIGRTSTMLIAAHMVLGERLDDLKGIISKQNPRFVMVGRQGEFIERVSRQMAPVTH